MKCRTDASGSVLATDTHPRERKMRFMVMIKASADSEADMEPQEGLLLEMGKYNEELVRAGIIFANSSGS